MKKIIPFLAFLTPTILFAGIDVDLSGNLEGQFRHSQNNKEAKDPPLYQDWDQENFYLLYGNLNGKVELGNSRIEANWFGRFSQSELYNPPPLYGVKRDSYLATTIYTFPNKLVARDVFQLQSVDQNGNHQIESVLNKFYYEWDYEEHRFMAGRMYVNYGLGEIFNPINPFNQPTGLTAISQVAQGNDGFSFTFFADEKHTIQFLLLGDKRIEGYDGQIDRTLWAHGEYQYNDSIQLDYVIGEDQNRQKVGGQVSFQLEEALVFSQVLYQSENVKNEPSNDLFDILLGYDEQLTSKWHLRVEGGHQKKNNYATFNSFERFLPTEYFLAVSNLYEVHPLMKINATIINDIKSGFTYLIGKGTYNLTKNTEAEFFGYVPVGTGDEPENLAQKLVTTDLGVGLRMFF